MRVVLHSQASRMGDVAGNVRTAEQAVRAARESLVVFPEMFLTGYAIGDDALRLALVDGDARLKPLLEACRATDSHLVVGAPRKARPGIVHNTAFLISPDGRVEPYDKRCLASFTTFREGQHFKPGRESPVWDTPNGRIGIGICYDLFFPEFGRRQSLEGADLLLNISASPATSRRFFEHLLVARAMENASFVAYSNLVGAQDGIVFWGGAQAIGPRGQVLDAVPAFAAGSVTVDLDWSDLDAARAFRPTLRDGAILPVAEAEEARDEEETTMASQRVKARAGIHSRAGGQAQVPRGSKT